MTVIDASVLVSRFIPTDINHQASLGWFNQELSQGNSLVVPILVLAEIAGAISRRTGQPQYGHQAVALLHATPTLQIIPIDASLGQLATHVAANLELKGADAIYVALASQLGLPLVTWDKEQLNRGSRLVATHTP